jgi:hypothetical protein
VNYLAHIKVDELFQWCKTGDVCRVTSIRDADLEIHYVYTTGKYAGLRGYTVLPQDVIQVFDKRIEYSVWLANTPITFDQQLWDALTHKIETAVREECARIGCEKQDDVCKWCQQ